MRSSSFSHISFKLGVSLGTCVGRLPRRSLIPKTRRTVPLVRYRDRGEPGTGNGGKKDRPAEGNGEGRAIKKRLRMVSSDRSEPLWDVIFCRIAVRLTLFHRSAPRETSLGHNPAGLPHLHSAWHRCNPRDRHRVFLRICRLQILRRRSGRYRYCP